MQNTAQGCAQANLSNEDVESFIAFFPFRNNVLDTETIDKISEFLTTLQKELDFQKETLTKLVLQRKVLQQYLLNGIVRV